LGGSDSADLGYDEEEDRKPSVQYLDFLNGYRRRSRSHEDVDSAVKIKQVKTEGIYGIDNGSGTVVNGYTPENGNEAEQDAIIVKDVALLPEDDPLVHSTPLSFFSISVRFLNALNLVTVMVLLNHIHR
jgi:transcription initiation factor TFIIE subunit alpha